MLAISFCTSVEDYRIEADASTRYSDEWNVTVSLLIAMDVPFRPSMRRVVRVRHVK